MSEESVDGRRYDLAKVFMLEFVKGYDLAKKSVDYSPWQYRATEAVIAADALLAVLDKKKSK